MTVERGFNIEKIYNDVVHYYVDKKGQTPDQANRIAQIVVMRETKRRTCHKCGHMNHDHIMNTKTCLYGSCQCTRFVTQPGLQTSKAQR